MKAASRKAIRPYLLILLATLILTAFNIRAAYKDSSDKWEKTNLETAKTIAYAIQNILTRQKYESEVVSKLLSKSELSPNDFNSLLSGSYAEDLNLYYNVGFIDTRNLITTVFPVSGDHNFNPDELRKLISENEAVRKYYTDAVASGHAVVSDIIKIKEKDYGIVVFSPVQGEKENKGCYFRIINVNNIVENAFKDKRGSKNDYFVVSKDGTWIYSTKTEQVVGKKFTEVIDKKLHPVAYANYLRIVKGDEFSNIHEKFQKDEYRGSGKKVLCVSPVKIEESKSSESNKTDDKIIMSVGVTTKKVEFFVMQKYFVIQMILLAFALALILYYTYKQYRVTMKNQKYRIQLEEKLKNFQEIKSLNKQVETTQYDMVRTLVKIIEMKDEYTRGHSERVTEYALLLGKELDYSEKQMTTLKYGAILHDIGKMGIPGAILKKKEKLTEEEYQEIKRHSFFGYDAVKDIGFLKEECDIVLHHHERIDGKGYPDRLKGEKINEMCRILSICDAFDAMTSHRVYHNNMSFEEAAEELLRCSGTQFDERLVEVFIQALRKDEIYKEKMKKVEKTG